MSTRMAFFILISVTVTVFVFFDCFLGSFVHAHTFLLFSFRPFPTSNSNNTCHLIIKIIKIIIIYVFFYIINRTPCKYPGKNIAFHVNEGSTDYWLSLLVEFEDGDGDIGSMHIKQVLLYLFYFYYFKISTGPCMHVFLFFFFIMIFFSIIH